MRRKLVIASGVAFLCLICVWLLVVLVKAKGDVQVMVSPREGVKDVGVWSECLRSSLEKAGYDVRSVRVNGAKEDWSGWVKLRLRPDPENLAVWARGVGECLLQDPLCRTVSFPQLPDEVNPDPGGPDDSFLYEKGWEAWLHVQYCLNSPDALWREQVKDLERRLSGIAHHHHLTIGESDTWGPRYQLSQHPEEKYRVVVRVRLLPAGPKAVHPLRFLLNDKAEWKRVAFVTRPGIRGNYLTFGYSRFGWKR